MSNRLFLLKRNMRRLTKLFRTTGSKAANSAVAVLFAAAAMFAVLWGAEVRVGNQFNEAVRHYQHLADVQVSRAESAISTLAVVDRSLAGPGSAASETLTQRLRNEYHIDQLLYAPVAGTAPSVRFEPFVPAVADYRALDLSASSPLYELALATVQTGHVALANLPELFTSSSAANVPSGADTPGDNLVMVHSVYHGDAEHADAILRKRHWRGIYVGFVKTGSLWNFGSQNFADLNITVAALGDSDRTGRSARRDLGTINKTADVVLRVSPDSDGVAFQLSARHPRPLWKAVLTGLIVLGLVGGGVLVASLVGEDRRRGREKMSLSAKERLRAEQTLAVVGDAVIRTTSDYEVTYFNEMARQMFGSCLDDEQAPRMDQMLFPAAASSELQEDALLVDPSVVLGAGDYVFRDQDTGDELLVNVQRTETDRIEDEGGAWIFVIRDVGVERAMASELEWRASRDELTGLYNRHAFETMAARIFNQKTGRNHALCIVDLDQFKIINDTAGHAVGDDMLRRVADTLNAEVRDDDLTARLGGDEFGFLLVNVNEAEIHRINARMVSAIGGCRVSWEDQVFQVGASIGIALTDGEQWSITDLMHNADKACFAAKKSGRGRSIVFRADDVHINQRESDILWINEIPKALQGNRFALDVQSIQAVNKVLKPKEVREVLVRMLSETGDVVAPSDFIPAAERHDLMARIDRWVLHHAFKEIARTPFAHDAVLYSINLSSRTLEEQDLGGFVIEQLQQSGVRAEHICFELTETAAVSDVGNASSFLKRMRDLGFKTALDDFGSGLASFRYLRSFPADFLKLDRSMVVEAAQDDRSRRLLEGVVDLCRDMGMLTVAEGIEDKHVYELMKSVGVDYVQGYYVSRPQRFLTPQNSIAEVLQPTDQAVG